MYKRDTMHHTRQSPLLFDRLSSAFCQPRAFIAHRLKKHTQPVGLRILVPNAECDLSKPHPQPPFLLASIASHFQITRLELRELLDSLAGSGKHAEDVESNGLGERSALANNDRVTGLDTEGGGDVSSEVLVALLVTRILGDEVEVLAADNEGSWIH